MKIHLTRKELCEAMTSMLGYTVTEVVIVREFKQPTAPPVAYRIMTEMRKHFNTPLGMEDFLRKHPEHKIASIKKLREITNMGLQDSKWAIENWSRWFKWVNEKGSIPVIEWANPTTGEPYGTPLLWVKK